MSFTIYVQLWDLHRHFQYGNYDSHEWCMEPQLYVELMMLSKLMIKSHILQEMFSMKMLPHVISMRSMLMFPKWDLFHFFNFLLVSLSFWSQWRVILELRDLKPLEKPVCKWGVPITLLQSNIIFFKNGGFWTDLLLGHHDLKLIWGDHEPVCVGTYPAISHWWRPCLVATWLRDHCIDCCTKYLGFWGGSSYKMRGSLVHDQPLLDRGTSKITYL